MITLTCAHCKAPFERHARGQVYCSRSCSHSEPRVFPRPADLSPMAIVLGDIRIMARLCQADLAEKSGVHQKTISSFETGERTMSIKVAQLAAICDACGVTLTDFFQRVAAVNAELRIPLIARTGAEAARIGLPFGPVTEAIS